MLNLPTDLPHHYRYALKITQPFGAWRYSYELVGRHGGIHLHISGPHVYDNRENWSAGLEYHWRVPPDHMRDAPPSHDKCFLLKCPCWHDGTSLYAQERYLPMVLAGSHGRVFRALVRDADEKLLPAPLEATQA